MAEAVAQAHSRKERPQTLGRAVEAIGEHPFHAVRRLLLGCRALKLAIGLGKGHGTGLRSIAQMPDHPATDNRGQIHFVGETVAMLFVGHEIGGQGQLTPGEHCDQALVTKRTDHAIEGHRGDMADHRAQLQTEAAMGRQQGIASDLRSHLAITQDEMWQDRKHML